MKSPAVHLVGTGVVGRAIIQAHLDAGISVTVSDQDETSLADTVESLQLPAEHWSRSSMNTPKGWLPSIELISREHSGSGPTVILIESISERLDVKQAFYTRAEEYFGGSAILCTNT